MSIEIVADSNQNFTILAPLGEGEQAKVVLVKDSKEKQFALKCFFEKKDVAEELASFFEADGTPFSARHEWTLGQTLQHPNLLRYYNFFPGPQTKILSEHVDGRTLNDVSFRSLSTPTTLRLIRQLANALAYALEKGFIHLDLSGDNLMIDREENLKLIDLEGFDPLEDASDITVAEMRKRLLQEFEFCLLMKGNMSEETQQEILEKIRACFSVDSQQDELPFPESSPRLWIDALHKIERI
jgi:serine/threonine protein kinase